MSLPESAASSAWIASGVQHAVLSRTMPALRHELSGSVSVLRMGLAVLKRKSEACQTEEERQALVQRMEVLDASIADLSGNLRRLRHWDRQTEETLNAHALFSEIQELAKPFLSLRGIALAEWPEPSADSWPIGPVRPQPLMYVVLASIYHLAEGARHVPQRIGMMLDASGIHIQGEGRAESDEALAPMPSSANLIGTPPIDRNALLCLGQHLGVQIDLLEEHSIRIGWPKENPPSGKAPSA